MKPLKLFIRTYGCQMNIADSQRAAALLEPKFTVVDGPEKADLVLINTCSVREKPQQKLLSELGRMSRIKKSRPSMLIGVMGCVAQQMKDELFKKAPLLDMVIGPDGIDDIPDLVVKALEGQQGQSTRLQRHVDALDRPVAINPGGPSAFVNIMKGCDKFCTFCIVPFTRGREASRSMDAIMEEVRELADKGVKDITLLGQNVTAYGKDLNNGNDLAQLINRIDSQMPDIARLRFITGHPGDMTQSIIEIFANEKVTPFFHLPLQAGSDRVLEMMGRGYTLDDYLRIVENVRKVRPDIAMASDFIVGFPGETREDFEKTLYAIGQVNYHQIYSFVYSPRPFTKAAKMDDPVSREEKLRWLQELQAMQNEITHNHYESMVGQELPILIEGPSAKNPADMAGRTPCNKVVNIPLPSTARGAIVLARITAAMTNSLRGEVI